MKMELATVEGVAVATVSGSLTLKDMREGAVTLWNSVEGPRFRVLWDLQAATFDLSRSEVQGLAEFIKKGSPAGDIRVAFVVSRDAEFGLVRMFEVFREAPNARTSVFRDRDAALRWLTASTAPCS